MVARDVSTRVGEVRVVVENEPGPPGKSAYEVWLEHGNHGDEDDFLEAIAQRAADIVIERQARGPR